MQRVWWKYWVWSRASDYGKTSKLSLPEGCLQIVTVFVEPYCAIYACTSLPEQSHVTVVMDNEARYDIVRRNLCIEPSTCSTSSPHCRHLCVTEG